MRTSRTSQTAKQMAHLCQQPCDQLFTQVFTQQGRYTPPRKIIEHLNIFTICLHIQQALPSLLAVLWNQRSLNLLHVLVSGRLPVPESWAPEPPASLSQTSALGPQA